MEEFLLQVIKWTAIGWVFNSWFNFIANFYQPLFALSCLKCHTFWLTLALTLNIPLACVCGLCAMFLDNYLSKQRFSL